MRVEYYYYAIVEHVGSIADLSGQEVTIAAVRMLREGYVTTSAIEETAKGRAWCQVFPTGEQVPTRGGIMRVRPHYGTGQGYADMLSADEMLARTRAENERLRDALRAAEQGRDLAVAENLRWRERAADARA